MPDSGLLVVIFIIGLGIGAGLVYTLRRGASQQALSDTLKAELQTLSQSALQQNSEQFLSLANERLSRAAEANTAELDTKKQLIDQRLEQMNSALEKVTTYVQSVEKARESKFTELSTQIRSMGEQTRALATTTDGLRQALTNTRARGQWGERMAEDILQRVGLLEGVNYRKQPTLDAVGSRPDFEFFLPGDLKMNMDVKFPLDNYLRFVEAPTDGERESFKAAFLRDVRGRIKEITTREYIDPEQGTVDYVLLFIPNEAVYAFIHEADARILDEGLQQRVVCCSPQMLFAMLALVRQAVESFALQKASDELLSLHGRFMEEWHKFGDQLKTLGDRINSVQKQFEAVAGTRSRQLQRPINRMNELRQRRGLPIAPSDDDGSELPALPMTSTEDGAPGETQD